MLLAVGGLVAYLVFGHPAAGQPGASGPAASHSPAPTPTVKVVAAITAGLVDFGPYDDGDSTVNDADDHPLMLQVTGGELTFASIPQSVLVSGIPQWTADQMSDGSDIFIYIPTGECLTAPAAAGAGAGTGTGTSQQNPRLAHCDLGPNQRWWPLNPTTAVGQAFSQFATWDHGDCLTAAQPDAPARLTPCAPARSKAALPQEIAFFWAG